MSAVGPGQRYLKQWIRVRISALPYVTLHVTMTAKAKTLSQKEPQELYLM